MDVMGFLERPQEAVLRAVALSALTAAYPPPLGARAVAAVAWAAHPPAPAPMADAAAAAASAAAYHRRAPPRPPAVPSLRAFSGRTLR